MTFDHLFSCIRKDSRSALTQLREQYFWKRQVRALIYPTVKVSWNSWPLNYWADRSCSCERNLWEDCSTPILVIPFTSFLRRYYSHSALCYAASHLEKVNFKKNGLLFIHLYWMIAEPTHYSLIVSAIGCNLSTVNYWVFLCYATYSKSILFV